MPPEITVVIPVGPKKSHATWLTECLQSVARQTYQPAEVLIIDDMHGLDQRLLGNQCGSAPLRVWYAPWHVGVPLAFNLGVGLARSPLVFLLGADDVLEPDCLRECALGYASCAATLGHDPDRCYYWVGVEYMDTGEQQFTPCNAALVTKGLWKATGGFPPESAVGACDSMLLSQIWLRPEVARIVWVGENRTLYRCRRHDASDTAGRSEWQGIIWNVRDKLTRDFQQPAWNRYD